MRLWIGLVCLVVLVGGGLARADDDEVLAPVAPAAPTTLSGRVTDLIGGPVVDAIVALTAPDGSLVQTKTDVDGHYTMTLPGGGTYAIAVTAGGYKVTGMVPLAEGLSRTLDVPVEADLTGGEIIHVHEKPKIPPQLTTNPRKSLPYSAQAMERDAWALAWLVLEIDEKGEVTRLKLLKRPGFDLDKIAIDEAFKLRFSPGLDAAGKPMKTLLLWKMEWPAWGWLVQSSGGTAGRPPDHDAMYQVGQQNDIAREAPVARVGVSPVAAAPGGTRYSAQSLPVMMTQALSRVPCAGSGPLHLESKNRSYRDCSKPDLTAFDALPWITRQNKTDVLAKIIAAEPPPPVRPKLSRVPELATGSVAAVFGVALVVSVAEYEKYADLVSKRFAASDAGQLAQPKAAFTRWQHRMVYSAAGFVASGLATVLLWNRRQTRNEFSVQPTAGGAAVSFGRSF